MQVIDNHYYYIVFDNQPHLLESVLFCMLESRSAQNCQRSASIEY